MAVAAADLLGADTISCFVVSALNYAVSRL